ncbi:DinB family protein [Nocardioides sp. AX2bis]|uniref:DinB family protein n=1 Tax=Nocardioides sp. AX2bis TaxID=2653157 RepID=UPI0012EF4439|nr:DinB family protein [Nocardioides sp. AX2bis]VXB65126.1 DinB superfamily protein [Nocardioides sp. AX2bis]
MPPETPSFVDRDLSGARFVRVDLSGARMRAVDLQGADLDAPWLGEEGGSLLVNGVDVAPLVEVALNERFPGRELRRAADPEGLRTAWAALERAWQATLVRAEAMGPGAVDVPVAGEWSFAQTLRHLVMATDTWLGRAVLQLDEPYDPRGVPHAEYATDGHDPAVFSASDPPWDEVLDLRAGRVAMVRDFLRDVTPAVLDEPRRNPWAPEHAGTVRSCLHVILNEEWEHLRYAVRDLDVVAAGGPS